MEHHHLFAHTPNPLNNQCVHVHLGPRSYTALVGRGLLANLGTMVSPHTGHPKLQGVKVAVVTDSNVGKLYAHTVMESLTAFGKQPVLIVVPAGENSKSLSYVEHILNEMASAGLDRGSFVVALGGGVIGDLAGFAASVYQRGIPYVQVPTTVLSQVDSSVGGKTGVNIKEAKNMVGSFHQPALVIADLATLDSLPKREWNSGFAEIIKHAAIKDPSLFEVIETVARGERDMLELIHRNVAIKAALVEADEFEETGLRATLNLGHTLGHAIEAEAGYGKLLHGEAISIGLNAATWLSWRRNTLSLSERKRVLEALTAFDLPLKLPEGMTTTDVLRRTRMDKKYEQGNVRFVLLNKLGRAFVSHDLTEADLIEALVHMNDA